MRDDEFEDIGNHVRKHDHRKGKNPWQTDNAIGTLEDLSVKGSNIDSFIGFLRQLEEYRIKIEREKSIEQARMMAFEAAMDSIEANVDSFGPLSAFDWLEFVIRLHGQEWLSPTILNKKLIKTGDGPQEGLERLFGQEAIADPSTCLERLERYAREDQEMFSKELIFGIESALCMFSPSHLNEVEFKELAETGELNSGSLLHRC